MRSVTPPAAADLAEVRGTIVRLFHASPDFSAGVVQTTDGEVKFAGKLMVKEHDPVLFRGTWETHPRFGRQLKVATFELDLNLDEHGLVRYLAHSPDFYGLGERKAAKLVDRFGADFGRALEEQLEEVAEVAKVPITTAEKWRETWRANASENAVRSWLASFELTNHEITKVLDRYGNSARAVLEKNPYLLMREISGFGFAKVDAIAQKMGTPKDLPERIQAGLIYAAEQRTQDGHTWTEAEELVEVANAMLALDVLGSRAVIERELGALLAAGDLASPSTDGRSLVALPALYRMEADLARTFSDLLFPNPHGFTAEELEAAARIPDKPDARLNEAQQRALAAAARFNMVVLTGGAGSGKTFTVQTLVRLYRARGLTVELAAPTGKAAKRIEEVVGLKAQTLHRLLGHDGTGFTRDAANPIDAHLVVVDETSMVDVPLLWAFLRAIEPRTTCVVFVGDHNQLPPVGPGNPLRDLIERQPLPTVLLDQVMRQAGVLKENSMAVLAGEVRPHVFGDPPTSAPPWGVKKVSEIADVQKAVLDLFEGTLERWGFDVLRDVQLLTPTKKGELGTAALNLKLQALVQRKLWGVDVPQVLPNRRPPILLNDRVIQMRNNYKIGEAGGVMNGSIGRVVEVYAPPAHRRVDFAALLRGDTPPPPPPAPAGLRPLEKNEIRVAFDDQTVVYTAEARADLELAYALTIHKSQGSEFPCAIVIVHRAHGFQHHRNLLYTGVTRARRSALLIGDHFGLKNCAEVQQVEKRKTFLSVLDMPDRSGLLLAAAGGGAE